MILAELLGWANNSDAYHVTEPRADGSVAAMCMEKALQRAGISSGEVDYINGHGTATKLGMQQKPQQSIGYLETPHLQSARPKGATGHMMGAGGVTEAIICILAMQHGILPPTLKFLDILDLICDLDYIPKVARKQKVQVCMSNAFGFGGQNSSLILKQYIP